MAKRNRATKSTSHGWEASFNVNDKYYKITLIDFVLSFYLNDELVNTKDFNSFEREKFVQYCYNFCDIFNMKKSQIKFQEI